MECKVLITSCKHKLGMSYNIVEIRIEMSDGVIWIVLFSHDYVHVFELWRNKFLYSKSIKFSNGYEFLKEDILQLMQKADSCICKFCDLHVNCPSSVCQNVKLASELVTDRTATLLLDLFPRDKRKESMALVLNLLIKVLTFLLATEKVKVWNIGSHLLKSICLNKLD